MKTLQGLMVVVVAVVVVAHGVVSDFCSPDCTGHSFLDQVADPNNCTYYYVCLDDGIPSDHSVPCDEGKYFNETQGGCVEETTPCENTCGSGGGGEPLDCKLTCKFDAGSGQLEYISDIDCSKYHVCFAGSVQGPFTCPPEHSFFDGSKCGDDDANCCHRICKPYCTTDDLGKVVPDPNDCHRFYLCIEGDAVPDEIYGFDCPVGKNFNLQLGECTSDAECVKICNSNSSNTTTPPSSTCNESLTCTETGFFPVCPYCDPRYLNCPSAGVEATLNTCPGSLVFHPTQHYCIKPENCSPSVVSAVVP
ncbi:peritrophin-48-like isoform X2 [Portunus trituberculatus]|uniref:peritrophin-48-like isoform X2 n=1 Tax=Portunus trituberculatus TaxID=210409 RepID=UPI001E1CD735|nr:peritrophin-48-like isoform X2 [Portunus trituberculatus]